MGEIMEPSSSPLSSLPQPSRREAELEQQAQELKSSRDDALRRLKETTGKLNNLVVNYSRVQQATADVEDQLKDAREEVDESQKVIDELKIARDEAVLQRQETAEQLRNLRLVVADLQAGKRSLEGQLKGSNTSFDDMQTLKSHLPYRQQIQELEQHRTNTEKKLQKARDALASLQAKNDQLQRDNNSKDEIIIDLQKRVALALKTPAKEQELLRNANSRIAELELEIENLHNDVAVLSQQLQEERNKAEEGNLTLSREPAKRKDDLSNVQNSSTVGRNDDQPDAAMDKVGKLSAKRSLAEPMASRNNQRPTKAPTKRTRDKQGQDSTQLQQENEILLQELSKAKKEIARVQGELQMMLNHDLPQLKTIHSAMQGGLKGANDDLEAGIHAAKKLQIEIDDLDAFNQALQEENQAIEKIMGIVQDKLKAATVERQNLKQAKEQLQSHLDKVVTPELEQSKADLASAQREIERLAKKLGESERNFAELQKIQTKELELLKSERADLKAKIDGLEFELKEAQGALKKTKESVDRNSKKIKQLERELAEARDENEILDKKKGQIDQLYAEERRRLKSEQELVSRIKAELSDVKGTNERSEGVIASLKRNVLALEDEVSDAQNEKAKATRQSTEKERELEGKLRAIKSEKDELEVRLAKVTRDLDESRTASAAKEASLVQQLYELQTAAAETDQQIRDAMETLRKDLDSAEREKKDSLQEIATLSKNLDEANRTISSLTRHNEDLTQQRGVQNGELDKMGLELGSIKRENDLLNGRVSNLELLRNEYNKLQDIMAVKNSDQGTARLTRQLDKRGFELVGLKKKLTKRSTDLEKLRAEHRELSKAHQGVVKASRDAAVALSQQLDQRNTEIADLKNKIRNAKYENMDTKEKLRKLEIENENTEKSLRGKRKEVDELVAEKNKLQVDRERALLRVEELNSAKQSVENSLTEAKSFSERIRHQTSIESQGKNEKMNRLARDLLLAEKQARDYGHHFEAAKAKLREAAVEKRTVSQAHSKETNALRHRISLLESRFEESTHAFAEVSATKERLQKQLMVTEADLANLREALASQENFAQSKERQNQIAHKRLMDKAQNLEQRLSSVIIDHESLQQHLSSTIAERDELGKALFEAHGNLEDAQSTLSTLQTKLAQAESRISLLVHSLAEVLRFASGSGEVNINQHVTEEQSKDPDNLIKNLRTVIGDTRRGHEEATRTKVGLEKELEELQDLSSSLKKSLEEKGASIKELKKSHKEEKDTLMAKLADLEQVVEQVSSNSKALVGELRSQLESATGECEMLRTDLEKSNKLQEALCASSESLEKSLNDASATVSRLEQEKADLRSRMDKEKASVRAEIKSLTNSLEEAKERIEILNAEMESERKNTSRSEENQASKARTSLEHALSDKERKLKDALQRLRVLDSQAQVFYDDALKLKSFLEQALHEAKLLLDMLRKTKMCAESDRNQKPSSQDILQLLEAIVKKIAIEIDAFDQPPPRCKSDLIEQNEVDIDYGVSRVKSNRPSDKPRDTSPTSSMADLELEWTKHRENQRLVETQYPRQNSTSDEAFSEESDASKPRTFFPGIQSRPFESRFSVQRKPEQEAYVQQRLAQSAAGATSDGARQFPFLSPHLRLPSSIRQGMSGIPTYKSIFPASTDPCSDPEVFNSPYLRYSSARPKRTPHANAHTESCQYCSGTGRSRDWDDIDGYDIDECDGMDDEDLERENLNSYLDPPSAKLDPFDGMAEDDNSRLNEVRWASTSLAY